MVKEMFSSSTMRTVLFVKNNFIPGPFSRSSSYWLNRNEEAEEKNISNKSSSYIYTSPLDEQQKELFILGTNQTMFLSSPFDYPIFDSSSMLIPIVLGIILFTITIWTILGNILVILAFVLDKQIRQGGMSNYLIINLAISDLLLGIAVLPFSASYSTFGVWYFGKFLCEFWLAIDVLCCTASIWGLLMIAFDRYIATNYPMRYRHHRHSIRLALSYICVAWFVSLAICLLPTLFFEKKKSIYSESENRTLSISPTKYTATNRQCELYKDLHFVVTSSILSFYFPLIIMIFLYVKVLYAIRQQSMKMKKNSRNKMTHRRKTSNQNECSNENPSRECSFIPCCVKSTSEANGSASKSSSFSQFFRKRRRFQSYAESTLTTEDIQHQLGRREITAEARVTRSLAVVIGCFICCWLPFFTLYIIRAVCACLSFNAIELFVWLGYSNSSINPVLYAILNKNFRLAFKNIFLSMKKLVFL